MFLDTKQVYNFLTLLLSCAGICPVSRFSAIPRGKKKEKEKGKLTE